MNYDEAVDYIINIPKFSSNPGETNKSGKDNILAVLKLLGNPQDSGRCIHIAGTNGKGSTCQFVKSILKELGYTVGVFTSPHLVRINERIEMDGYISDEDFLDCFEKVYEAVDENVKNGGLNLSFFEYIFAMAAVYFDSKKPDYVIYETGLGGRLDATNVIKPIITAITSIGLDHTEYLGDTIEKIAFEKAGIIKANIPVIYNTGCAEADAVIEKTAKSLCAKAINVAKTDYIINEITDKSIDFSVHNSYYNYHNLVIPTGARYQIDNAMNAIIICNTLLKADTMLDEELIKNAFSHFIWSGRMERIHSNVVLDGAHNVDAITRFVESVPAIAGNRKISILFAVAGDKDYQPMIELICDRLEINRVFVTAINSKRGVSSAYIAGLFEDMLGNRAEGTDCTVTYDDDIKLMFNKAFHYAVDYDNILFCVGSLYLVGDIKQMAREVLND